MTDQNEITIFTQYNERNYNKIKKLIGYSYYYENEFLSDDLGHIIEECLKNNITIYGFFYGPVGGNQNLYFHTKYKHLYFVSKNKQDLIKFLSQQFDNFEENDIRHGSL